MHKSALRPPLGEVRGGGIINGSQRGGTSYDAARYIHARCFVIFKSTKTRRSRRMQNNFTNKPKRVLSICLAARDRCGYNKEKQKKFTNESKTCLKRVTRDRPSSRNTITMKTSSRSVCRVTWMSVNDTIAGGGVPRLATTLQQSRPGRYQDQWAGTRVLSSSLSFFSP